MIMNGAEGRQPGSNEQTAVIRYYHLTYNPVVHRVSRQRMLMIVLMGAGLVGIIQNLIYQGGKEEEDFSFALTIGITLALAAAMIVIFQFISRYTNQIRRMNKIIELSERGLFSVREIQAGEKERGLEVIFSPELVKGGHTEILTEKTAKGIINGSKTADSI